MAQSPLLQKINQSYVEQLRRAPPDAQRRALQTFNRMASDLRKLPVSGNELMKESSRLITRIYPMHIGRLCMFYYYPKLQKELPYYDRFPLIMPIEVYNDGFLGLNFHYLPNRLRAQLMDAIYDTVIKDTHLNEKQRIFFSYRIMKRVIKIPNYMPTIKRYLYTHLRSRIHVLAPDAWNVALFLPLERFEKANIQRVHADSIRKIRNYGSF